MRGPDGASQADFGSVKEQSLCPARYFREAQASTKTRRGSFSTITGGSAEHIVEQEVALEKQVAVAREEEVQFTEELKRKSLIEKVCYGAAATACDSDGGVDFHEG